MHEDVSPQQLLINKQAAPMNMMKMMLQHVSLNCLGLSSINDYYYYYYYDGVPRPTNAAKEQTASCRVSLHHVFLHLGHSDHLCSGIGTVNGDAYGLCYALVLLPLRPLLKHTFIILG